MIKKFQLGAVNWEVKVDNDRLDDLNLIGLCETSKSLISLHDGINSELMEQTFYHELVHAILNSLSRQDLSNDEVLVQGIAVLLHQFESTKK